MNAAQKWPRLSQTLPPFTSLGTCQKCGIPGVGGDAIVRWVEHDDNDKAESIVVCLCKKCSDAIIEPHPRLYHYLQGCEPWPGAMQICRDCKLRDGTRCTSPSAKANGGTGVMLAISPPTRAHVDGVHKGKRFGQWLNLWHSPASACKQREVVA